MAGTSPAMTEMAAFLDAARIPRMRGFVCPTAGRRSGLLMFKRPAFLRVACDFQRLELSGLSVHLGPGRFSGEATNSPKAAKLCGKAGSLH
jgi:hypothetical protein